MIIYNMIINLYI